MFPRHLLTLLFGLTLGHPLLAADWPEFRGATGQGRADVSTLPLEWRPGHPNIVWRTPLSGEGWSSPVVAGGRIYLTAAVPLPGAEPQDLSLVALCLSCADGQILWSTDVFRQEGRTAPAIHSKNSHASPTPLVVGDRLIVHFGHQGTACLDLTGKLLWTSHDAKYEPVHGNGGSPALVDDRLVFSCDGANDPFVTALRLDDGQTLWRTPRNVEAERRFSFATPLLIESEGRRQIILPGSNAVISYDPDGRELWRVRYDGYSVVPRPVFGHGLVYVCTGYGPTSLLAIRPTGQGDVTDSHVAWSAKRAVPKTPSLLLVGDELYAVSDEGVASCYQARTGKVHWQQRLGGGFSSSPVIGADRMYVTNEEGVSTVIRPGPMYKQLAQNPLDERTLASPAIADNAIYIRTAQALYRIEERDAP